MDKVELAPRKLRTQSDRWDYVLSGNVLIVCDGEGEEVVGILNGELFNFTEGVKSKLTLNEDVTYSAKMKENKVKKYLYVYVEDGQEHFKFSTDEEFEIFKISKANKITSYDRHEGAWIEQ